MIICVLEYPEDDQAQVWFLDTDKLDMDNPSHVAYHVAMESGLISHSKSFFFSNKMDECSVDLPCHVDEHITVYVE